MTLEELTSALVAQTYVAAEGWYYLMTGLMVAIHVGFLMYEVGASRMKNAVSSGVKNLLAFAFMIPTFWLFGWYIYLAFPHGLVPMDMEGYGVPWNVSMGPMLSDQLTGVFWAAFTLFACTTASAYEIANLFSVLTFKFFKPAKSPIFRFSKRSLSIIVSLSLPL